MQLALILESHRIPNGEVWLPDGKVNRLRGERPRYWVYGLILASFLAVPGRDLRYCTAESTI
jgi:hypothetical protein